MAHRARSVEQQIDAVHRPEMLSTLFSPVTAAWRFVKNHKKVVALTVIGGTAVGGFYVYRKLKPLMYVSALPATRAPRRTGACALVTDGLVVVW